MLPDRVSNPGPLTYESGALPIALLGLTSDYMKLNSYYPVMVCTISLTLLHTEWSKLCRVLAILSAIGLR